jgi:hypothetical protein
MRYKIFLVTLLLAFCCAGNAQEGKDTAGIVREFRKLMEFMRRPYVFYTTKTTIASRPVIVPQDTATMQGRFYKNGTDVYYSNGPDEVYLQDSLMVQVNHERKSIWISRVDMKSKEKMNVLQVGNDQLLQIMQNNYSMQNTMLDHRTIQLHFASRQMQGHSTYLTSLMDLQYDEKTDLPQQLSVEIRMQQPASDAMVAAFKEQGIDVSKLIETINGARWLVRTQKMTTAFNEISNEKKIAMQMPWLTSVLDYDIGGAKFTAKAAYTAYEITKTF